MEMDRRTENQLTAMEFLERMFEIELAFIQSGSEDVEPLAEAFHPDVVVHEPQSLPYSGDWQGLHGVAALFYKMREVWSDMKVENLTAAREGATVFMTCTLHLTCRVSGLAMTQPFAQVLRLQHERLIEATPFYYDTVELNSALTSSGG